MFRSEARLTLLVRNPREAGAIRELLLGFDPTLPDRTAIEAVSRLAQTSADVVWYAGTQFTVVPAASESSP